MEKNKSRNITRENRQALRWVLSASKGLKRYVTALLALQIIISLCSVEYSLLFRDLVDRAVEQHQPGFYFALWALVGTSLLMVLMRAVSRYLDEYTRSSIENALKRRLFDTLMDRDFGQVTAVHNGEWMNRLTSDTVVVASGLAQIIPNVGGMLVKMVGALSAIVVLEPLLGLLILPAGLALLIISRVYRPMLKRLHGNIQQSDGALRVLMQERLDNMLILRAYSQQKDTLELADEKMEAHQKARIKRNHASNISSVGFSTAMQGMYLLGAFFCGVGIIQGTVSFGTLTAVLQLIAHLQSPFSSFSGFLQQWYAMLSSAERLMEAEAFARDAGKDTVSQEETLRFYETAFTGIRVEDLEFTYMDISGEKAAVITIRDVNLEVNKGEFVSLVGPSGCGKSTLLKLLMSLYAPDGGRILVMCKDPQNNRELQPGDRRLFAYVPQGNQLMSGTIRDIVAFYDPEAATREAELWQALKIACAEEFVSELPEGLDAVLGEHGCGLSEGQIQRIAVARAIFSRRPILLLDESTSALDEVTEERLLNNLRTMTDRTVLIVTHRPQAIRVCDRVVQLKPGEKSIRE